jgi:hypothetical protein
MMKVVSWSILFIWILLVPLASLWGQIDYSWYDITDTFGIASPERLPPSGRYGLPEASDGKVIPFDFDQDGDLDLLITYGPHMADSLYLGLNRFYRNDGTVWTDITAATGLSHFPPAANAAAGDVDGDGYLDLYLCLFGSDRFLHNDSGMMWIDITDSVGLSNDNWATEAVFVDANRDGYLDIYVANYIDYSGTDTIVCIDPVRRRRTTCDPLLYDPAPNRLFINDSSGHFTEMTAPYGLADTTSRSLGIELLDANCDGYLDLFVLSERSPNLLYLNTDSGFVEHGLYAGLAVTPGGEDPGWTHTLPFDNDLDGCTDLIFLDRDANITVMLNNGRGLFFAGHFQTGIYRPRFPFKATTAIEADADFNGKPDLILSDRRDTPVRIVAPDTTASDSSAAQEEWHEEVLTESVMRILLSDTDYLYEPIEISRNMVLDTVLLVPQRAAISKVDTTLDFITGELLGPEDLPPSSYEDLLRDPLFDLPVEQDLTTDQESNAMFPDDSVLSIDSLGFIKPEREEYIEMDTLRVRQGPKSLLAVDLDQDGIEEIIAGYSVGLFRIWKRKLARMPRFIGLWPQTRDPSVPVIGTEIQIMSDRYIRQFLITNSNPVLLYLPRKVRSVEVLVKWPDGYENRYRTPITNRIYTLTRMVQEP